jgi:hypothetical protein
MSHEETVRRMNAELNTPESWERRWQIEREHNERLMRQAGLVRAGVTGLRQAAVARYASNQRMAAQCRQEEDARRVEIHERMCVVQSGMVRALDDVLQLLDEVEAQ